MLKKHLKNSSLFVKIEITDLIIYSAVTTGCVMNLKFHDGYIAPLTSSYEALIIEYKLYHVSVID